MTARTILLFLLSGTLSALCAHKTEAQNLKPEDIVIVTFEFDIGPDDSIKNVHAYRCESAKDRSVVKDALTAEEKQLGAQIVSQLPFSQDRTRRGKKAYFALAFDVRARKYLKPKA